MASAMLSVASVSPSASLSTHETPMGKLKLGSSWSLNKERNCLFTKTESFGRVSMVAAVNVSKFEGVTMAPPDPILGVSEAFKSSTNESKLDLGVGAYRTEELQPYVLDVFKKYLPIEGLAAFNKVTAELLFGADNPVIRQQRVSKKSELVK